jgi:hypothetical protein
VFAGARFFLDGFDALGTALLGRAP